MDYTTDSTSTTMATLAANPSAVAEKSTGKPLNGSQPQPPHERNKHYVVAFAIYEKKKESRRKSESEVDHHKFMLKLIATEFFQEKCFNKIQVKMVFFLFPPGKQILYRSVTFFAQFLRNKLLDILIQKFSFSISIANCPIHKIQN